MAGFRTFLCALAFAAGIIAAGVFGPGAFAGITAAAAGTASLLLAAMFHCRHPDPLPGQELPTAGRRVVFFTLAGLAATGFASLTLRLSALDSSSIARRAGESVELVGRVATDPRPGRFSSRFQLAVRELEGRPVREKIEVTVFGRPLQASVGDSVRLTAKIKALDRRDDFEAALARKSIVARASVAASEVRVLGHSTNPALLAANFFRSKFAAAAQDGAGPGRSGMLLALVMGDGRGVPERVVEDFRAAGLSHLTAVSGQNVAMVLGPLVLLMTGLRLSRKTQVALSFVVLGLFAVVTRWEPSVLRAVLMASAVASAWLFGRRADTLHLLSLVFSLLLAVDPLLLWSIGFQLSFAATAGILLVGPSLMTRLSRPFRLLEGQDDGRPWGRYFLRPVLGAAAIGIAAQGAVTPLIAWHFGKLSLVSLPANLAALPLIAPITVLGLAGGVVALLSEEAAGPFMWLAGNCISALQAVAGYFGRSPNAVTSVEAWSLFGLTAVCLGIAAGGLWLRGQASAARWPAVVGIVTAIAGGLLPEAGAGPVTALRLTFFDVGQGDAALVQSPAGARILIDGGPDPTLVAARLERMGISRLDLVVASHGHRDHVEGLAEVMRRFRVRAAVDPGVPSEAMTAMAGRIPGSSSLDTVADEHRIQIGDVRIDFLGPQDSERSQALQEHAETSSSAEGKTLNDASVVARVAFGSGCALFPGDLEEQGQAVLMETHPGRINCTVLKAPHHGSARLLAQFVKTADPEWVPISVGRNDYGHPAPRAVSIYRQAGARVLRTDRMGDIVLDIGRNGSVTLKE